MMRFAGRRVVVTGASRGIGAALAQRFAAEGSDVAIVARTLVEHDHLAGSLEATAHRLREYGGRVVVISADLTDEDSRAVIIPKAVEGLGGSIEILVNNAAAAMYAPMLDFSLKRRRLIFEANVHAPFDLAQAVLPAMIERGEGWIVNLSSGSTRHAVGPPFPKTAVGSTIGVYGASKAALNRLTNALAQEVEGTGVRVNTIEPRAAVMSEGAAALVGSSVTADQIESMEAMVEGTIALCDCAADLTGRCCVSLDLISEFRLVVHALDGTPIVVGAS